MQNPTQIRNFLVAGTLTSLVIVAFFVFGQQTLAREKATTEEAQTAVDLANQTIEALQQQNTELVTNVQTYQEREAAYRTQLETANETIQQVQNDVSLSQDNVTALAGQSVELEQTLADMSIREAEYVAGIEAANATIQQLEADANAQTAQYEATLGSLQAKNSELVQLLQLMQSREVEYQAQIDLANQTIQELQANMSAGSYHDDDDDHYEDHEDDDDHDDEDDDDD